jgi:hypothetical protein
MLSGEKKERKKKNNKRPWDWTLNFLISIYHLPMLETGADRDLSVSPAWQRPRPEATWQRTSQP